MAERVRTVGAMGQVNAALRSRWTAQVEAHKPAVLPVLVIVLVFDIQCQCRPGQSMGPVDYDSEPESDSTSPSRDPVPTAKAADVHLKNTAKRPLPALPGTFDFGMSAI